MFQENRDCNLGADPEFWNRGPKRGRIATERRVNMMEYLQVLVLSNCILTVIHIQNRHFRSIYELKY